MEVFRLSRSKYSRILSGKGAALKGTRWNSPGVELIYTAANRSLAMAEVAVHLSLATLPTDFVMNTIFIPDSIEMKFLNLKTLGIHWNAFPHHLSTQSVGDRFIADGEYPVLRVPSAVTRGDFNYLINPRHADFKRIKIIDTENFPWDDRVFR